MKIAIIGAATGQRALYLKAKEMGLAVISFAWPQGAVCKELADKFYPVSILEMDRIVGICREEQVAGVVSNGSDLTAKVAAYVSEKLHLNGIPYKTMLNVLDKYFVREATVCVEGLSLLPNYVYNGQRPQFVPCVVKPAVGGVN